MSTRLKAAIRCHFVAFGVNFVRTTTTLHRVRQSLLQLIDLISASLIFLPIILDQLIESNIAFIGLHTSSSVLSVAKSSFIGVDGATRVSHRCFTPLRRRSGNSSCVDD